MSKKTLKTFKKIVGVFGNGPKKDDFENVDLTQPVPTEITPDTFPLLLAHARAGNATLHQLLTGMFDLKAALNPSVLDRLFKFLCKDQILVVGNVHTNTVRLYNVFEHATRTNELITFTFCSFQTMLQIMVKEGTECLDVTDDMEVEKQNQKIVEEPDAERSFRYSYVVHQLIVGGTVDLRKSIAFDPVKMGILFDFYAETPAVSSVVLTRVTRSLLGTLQDFPEETTRQLIRRKQFFTTASKHLNNPLVVEVFARVFSSGVQSDEPEGEVTFGPLNPIGVPLLASVNIYGILATEFVEKCSASSVSLERFQTMENAARSVVAIALRALLTPRLDKNNGEVDKILTKNLNRALNKLNIFVESTPLAMMLDAALEVYERDGDHTPLTVLLPAIAELNNRLFSARRIKDDAHDASYVLESRDFDEALAQRTEKLVKLLGFSDEEDEIPAQPLGLFRLTIIDLLACRMKTTNEIAIGELVVHGVPKLMLRLFFSAKQNSIVHTLVLKAVELVMSSHNEILIRAFIRDADIFGRTLRAWEVYQNTDEATRTREVLYMGPLYDIALCVKCFLDRNAYSSVSCRVQVEDLIDQKTMMEFDQFCSQIQQEIRKLQMLVGQSTLPMRVPSILRTLGPLTKEGALV